MPSWLSTVQAALSSWNPYYTERVPIERRLRLPQVLRSQNFTRELRVNTRCKEVSSLSDAWLRGRNWGKSFSNPESLKAGLLASMCFPTVDHGQLNVCSDVLNWMLHYDRELSRVEGIAEVTLSIETTSGVLLSDDYLSAQLDDGFPGRLCRCVHFFFIPIRTRRLHYFCYLLGSCGHLPTFTINFILSNSLSFEM